MDNKIISQVIVIAVLLVAGLIIADNLIYGPEGICMPNDVSCAPPVSDIQEFKIIKIDLVDGMLDSEMKTFSVNEGDRIQFIITSDEAGEFHLHGYDLTVNLNENASESLKFLADMQGRFELEFHYSSDDVAHSDDEHSHNDDTESSDQLIGHVEVLP